MRYVCEGFISIAVNLTAPKFTIPDNYICYQNSLKEATKMSENHEIKNAKHLPEAGRIHS